MLDSVCEFIPAWQRGLMARVGRLVLVNSVIAAKPIHHLLVLDPLVWVLGEIYKWMKAFWGLERRKLMVESALWLGRRYVSQSSELKTYSYIALRMRWGWLKRNDPNRPWQGLELISDELVRATYDSQFHITVGDGSRILFWRHIWINGHTAADIAPLIVQRVHGIQNCSRCHD